MVDEKPYLVNGAVREILSEMDRESVRCHGLHGWKIKQYAKRIDDYYRKGDIHGSRETIGGRSSCADGD